jgi:hypothetical protein
MSSLMFSQVVGDYRGIAICKRYCDHEHLGSHGQSSWTIAALSLCSPLHFLADRFHELHASRERREERKIWRI